VGGNVFIKRGGGLYFQVPSISVSHTCAAMVTMASRKETVERI
jgi:hypothetical protein